MTPSTTRSGAPDDRSADVQGEFRQRLRNAWGEVLRCLAQLERADIASLSACAGVLEQARDHAEKLTRGMSVLGTAEDISAAWTSLYDADTTLRAVSTALPAEFSRRMAVAREAVTVASRHVSAVAPQPELSAAATGPRR